MGAFVVRRLLQTLLVLLITSFAVFCIIRLVPGDVAGILAGPNATPDQLEEVRRNLGLDQSIPVQFANWLSKAVTGDLGRSYLSGRTTVSLIAAAFPMTLQLAVFGILAALVIGVPLGVYAGMKPGGPADGFCSLFFAVNLGVPNFLAAIVYILVFSLVLGWLPPGGYVNFMDNPSLAIKAFLLPALSLAAPTAAVYAQFVRESVRSTFGEDYVRTAWAKGLSAQAVIIRHVLRNALIPLTTVLGVQFGRVLGGTVIIETIFSWPGMGRLTVQALTNHDYMVFQGLMLVLLAAAAIANLLVDIGYGYLDPRIRGA